MEIKRSIKSAIDEFINEKIILLSGPRQVGKTFLSKKISEKHQYFNYDLSEHRKIIQEKSWVRDGNLVIFDEIHKMKKWKQWIKGVYDTEDNRNKFILTGSARMDALKKVGDSLAGRNYSIRLNPFSIREVLGKNNSGAKGVAQTMLELGSFPEPFLGNSSRKAALWRKGHLDIIIRQDLVQTEQVRDILSIELLVDALRSRVGQQIVYKNLADELQVSSHTVKKWIDILESLFVVFRVFPFTKNVLDAVKKEPKIYFYDIGQVHSDLGFKIENLVALHLLKRNQFLDDTEGSSTRLCYIRDKKKREVDFAIASNSQLTHLIEVKASEDSFNPSLNYFANRLFPQKSYQLVFNLNREKDYESHKVRDLSKFLANLET